MIIDPVLQLFAVLSLALVFGFAAVSKMTAWAELEGVVQNFRLVPGPLVPLVAWLLPPVELVLAVLAFVPATRAFAGAAMAVLLAVFALAMAINIGRGRTEIDCGCFRSSLRTHLSWWLVLRNALLVVLAVLCMVPASERALGWADNFVIVMASLVLFLTYLSVGLVTRGQPPTYEENFERSLANRT